MTSGSRPPSRPVPRHDAGEMYTSARIEVPIDTLRVWRKLPIIRVTPTSMLTATAREATATDVVCSRTPSPLRL